MNILHGGTQKKIVAKANLAKVAALDGDDYEKDDDENDDHHHANLEHEYLVLCVT